MNDATTKTPIVLNGQDPNKHVHSRQEFAQFVRTLAEQFRCRPVAWENGDLAAYLEAIAAWVTDMEGYYRNRGESVPDQPTWHTLQEILEAAKVYE